MRAPTPNRWEDAVALKAARNLRLKIAFLPLKRILGRDICGIILRRLGMIGCAKMMVAGSQPRADAGAEPDTKLLTCAQLLSVIRYDMLTLHSLRVFGWIDMSLVLSCTRCRVRSAYICAKAQSQAAWWLLHPSGDDLANAEWTAMRNDELDVMLWLRERKRDRGGIFSENMNAIYMSRAISGGSVQILDWMLSQGWSVYPVAVESVRRQLGTTSRTRNKWQRITRGLKWIDEHPAAVEEE